MTYLFNLLSFIDVVIGLSISLSYKMSVGQISVGQMVVDLINVGQMLVDLINVGQMPVD